MNILAYCVPHPHIIKKCKKQIISDKKNIYYIYGNSLFDKNGAIKYFSSLFANEFRIDNIIYREFTYNELGINIPSYLVCTNIDIDIKKIQQKNLKIQQKNLKIQQKNIEKKLKEKLDAELEEIHKAVTYGSGNKTIDELIYDIME